MVDDSAELAEQMRALKGQEAAALLRAQTAEEGIKKQDSDWAKLMAEIAKLDPSWEPELGEPDPDDPQFREQYDPWHGLRLIGSRVKELEVVEASEAKAAKLIEAAETEIRSLKAARDMSQEKNSQLRAERDSLIDDLDLARDEFKRIANYSDGNAEVKGLAERGQKKITQNVPVLTQRDGALKEIIALKAKLDIIVRESAGDAEDALAADYGGTGWERSPEVSAVRAARRDLMMLLADALIQLRSSGAVSFAFGAALPGHVKRSLIAYLHEGTSEPGKPGVGLGVVCFQVGRILLGKRHPDLDGGGQWELPGGSLKWGESWEEGARREIEEETGLPHLTNFRLITVKPDYRPEDGKHNVILFVAFDAQGVAKRKEPKKSQGWEWFTLDKLPEGPMFPALRVLLTEDRDLLV